MKRRPDLADMRRWFNASMISARYQPIVRFADRSPIGLETLARLDEPALGLLSGESFVPWIEEAGLAPELTDVIGSCAFTDFTGDSLPPGVRLGLNLPIDVLLMPECLDALDRKRRAAGLSADRVTLEVTESRPLDDVEAVGRAVRKLSADGYILAIDDMSPAVPHHAAMLDMAVSIVKLDKSVTQGSATVAAIRSFLTAVLRLAERRSIAVIAEGVEDETTWEAMKAFGLRGAQGYHISHPLDAAQAAAWLETAGRPSASG